MRVTGELGTLGKDAHVRPGVRLPSGSGPQEAGEQAREGAGN